MNFLSAAERLAKIDRSQVLLRPQRCLPAFDQFAACACCSEICPVNAIETGAPPAIHAQRCTHCYACLTACPTGALSADDSVPSLLNCAARIENGSLELFCERHTNPQAGVNEDTVGVIVRGCLASLGAGTLVALVALGMKQIYVRCDACADCAWGSLLENIRSQVQDAGRLLDAMGYPDCIELIAHSPGASKVERPLWDAHNPPLSRRDLFRLGARQGQIALARAVETEGDGKEKKPPKNRQRLLNAMNHLQPSCDLQEIPLQGSSFALLEVSPDCTACGACARICPTGAINFVTQDSKTFHLSFTPRLCTACEACAHVCAPGAIALDFAPLFSQVFSDPAHLVLSEGALARCERCNTLMAERSGSRLCQVCELRRKNPFASAQPQGLRPVPGGPKDRLS